VSRDTTMRIVYPLLILSIFLLESYGAKIVVYYTNYSQFRVCNSFVPENLKPILQNITHINYAFAQLNTSGYITPTEYNDCDISSGWPGCTGTSNNMYNRITNLKLLNPNLIISITIGGASWNNVPACPVFSAMAANSQTRATFVSQAVAFARKFSFDGIDIDWEFPG
jgi:chitinase